MTIISRIAWSILGIVAVVMIISMFYPQFQQYIELQRRQAAMEVEYQLELEELKNLQYNQQRMKAEPEFAEQVAREHLGFAKKGETVIRMDEERR